MRDPSLERPAFGRVLPVLLLLLTVFGPIYVDLYLPALPTSGLCAVSPTIELLIVARFAQGLAGSIGVGIAQAAGRDIYSGGELIRFYGRLTVMGGFRETLPFDRRIRGGFRRTMGDFHLLISDREFLGAVLSLGSMYAGLFAYLSGSSFVLRDIYGLSPLTYALAFGVNSAGFMASGYLAGRGAEKWSVRGTLTIGIIVAGAGARSGCWLPASS